MTLMNARLIIATGGWWVVAGLCSGQVANSDLLQEVRQRPAMNLHQFEAAALERNPTLRQAQLAVEAAKGFATQAGALPNPVVGYQGEQIRGGAFHGGEQGAFVQQTVVLGGKLRSRRTVAEEQRKGAELQAEEQRTRVIADVRLQFYRTLAAQASVNVRQRLVRVTADAVETARQLANVGQADAPDVLQAEVEAETATADYQSSEREFLAQFATLAAISGQGDLPPAPLSGDLEKFPQLSSNEALANLLQSSPATKIAAQKAAIADAQLQSARRERVPDLLLHAGVQNNFEPIGSGPYVPVGVQAFATVGLTLPLFNRNTGNIRAAAADTERAHLEASRIHLQLQAAAIPVAQEYLAEKEEADRYRLEILPRAEKAYTLYVAKYREMAAAYPEVLVSQRTWFDLQSKYIAVLERVWSDALALQNFLLSGGLNAPPPASAMSLPGSQAGLE